MLRRTALALSSAISLVACSIFTDLSGLHVADVASQEGGPVGDGGEASVADAGSPEVGSSPDAQARFCAGSTHAFCEDFDDGALLDGWTKTQLDSVGTLERSAPMSESRSLYAMLPRESKTAPDRRATLDKIFPSAWRRVVVELELYLEQPDWMMNDINAGLVSIEFFSSSTFDGVYLSAGETYSNINDGSGAALPIAQWVHLKIDVDYPNGRITGKVGGNAYSSSFTPKMAGDSPSVSVSLGVNGFNRPAPRFAVRYDNVTVDLL